MPCHPCSSLCPNTWLLSNSFPRFAVRRFAIRAEARRDSQKRAPTGEGNHSKSCLLLGFDSWHARTHAHTRIPRRILESNAARRIPKAWFKGKVSTSVLPIVHTQLLVSYIIDCLSGVFSQLIDVPLPCEKPPCPNWRPVADANESTFLQLLAGDFKIFTSQSQSGTESTQQ